MDTLLEDPLAAGFIWRFGLLAFAWIMYYSLSRSPSAQVWWNPLLTRVGILRRDAREVDHDYALDVSRVLFKGLGIIATLLMVVHGYQYYRRANPYFLFGPPTVQFTGPQAKPTLPQAKAGAGGGGAFQPLAAPSATRPRPNRDDSAAGTTAPGYAPPPSTAPPAGSVMPPPIPGQGGGGAPPVSGQSGGAPGGIPLPAPTPGQGGGGAFPPR